VSLNSNDQPAIRILVVDDDEAILQYVCAGLEIAGFRAKGTSDGEEALAAVRDGHSDLVLLDLFMTPVTGFDILTKLRDFSDIPVVVFTARDDIGGFALETGADGYLGKPFKTKTLIEKIEEVIAKRGENPK